MKRRKVFDGVSLRLEPAKIHAVVGNNGSGKSTLLRLILNLNSPQVGRVLWDGADIRQFTDKQIAEWCGYVPQECALFTGSIRDNIAGFEDCVSDEDVIEISRSMGLMKTFRTTRRLQHKNWRKRAYIVGWSASKNSDCTGTRDEPEGDPAG